MKRIGMMSPTRTLYWNWSTQHVLWKWNISTNLVYMKRFLDHTKLQVEEKSSVSDRLMSTRVMPLMSIIGPDWWGDN